ncbi:hypothetical protein C5Y96_11815 [Blastopirellula marina]|uniref:Uncharacterized protein n=1 Tax=Blastopirellula marina TaxID=124 RepID=A0A2S8FFU7_9BACT|nr:MULTISPECIES: hypothetical protein [Pirellulaceae]PQO31039.1 hypothetical protein C5Y96_11815 [Blastopirellula marina]RCS51433.1 hypothetical protein DTL36_11825 [Bremerella cremea]
MYKIDGGDRTFMIRFCPMCGSEVRYFWTPLELSDEQRAELSHLLAPINSSSDIERELGPPDEFINWHDTLEVPDMKVWKYFRLVPYAVVSINEDNQGMLSFTYSSI